jgi:TM2 domain-containing membrane protein YozV
MTQPDPAQPVAGQTVAAQTVTAQTIVVQPIVTSSGSGSTGNVIAALASFFLPGLGQLIQGRPLAAVLFFLSSLLLWCCCLGWIPQIWATLDAAVWRPKN